MLCLNGGSDDFLSCKQQFPENKEKPFFFTEDGFEVVFCWVVLTVWDSE